MLRHSVFFTTLIFNFMWIGLDWLVENGSICYYRTHFQMVALKSIFNRYSSWLDWLNKIIVVLILWFFLFSIDCVWCFVFEEWKKWLLLFVCSQQLSSLFFLDTEYIDIIVNVMLCHHNVSINLWCFGLLGCFDCFSTKTSSTVYLR